MREHHYSSLRAAATGPPSSSRMRHSLSLACTVECSTLLERRECARRQGRECRGSAGGGARPAERTQTGDDTGPWRGASAPGAHLSPAAPASSNPGPALLLLRPLGRVVRIEATARLAVTAAVASGECGGVAASMMKFKPNQTRTYDREGFKKRAACLCFRNEREDEILLVSSSRYPDQWIVPGGGMEPEEEPGGAAVREVYEEAGVKGKLGRLLGIFENQDRKHRTYVYILTVTEVLEDWEDSVNIGRKREWFKVEDALKVLQCHKPVHAEYLEKLKLGCSPTNGNSVGPPLSDNTSLYVTSAQTSGLPSTVR
ncbi:diphosphoinositol polyphosphate phosphohydrolase 2 isoform 1-T1 [Anomaloglossus baeobatrachus]|uniref:diphosphoinositol polyphosphate phosphohydrolase 2 n=1 Tax=Anomaloglossus baeobatrachus TaxID=238106 RepID=UPI003F4F4E5B